MAAKQPGKLLAPYEIRTPFYTFIARPLKTIIQTPIVNEPKLVLYADDDLDDKNWVSEASKAAESLLELKFVSNGRDVLRYLDSMDGKAYPSLIVLDLNMPELDGRQTLKALKAHSAYNRIPVAVVTTSSSKIDQEVCKRLGASLYLTKPNSYTEWQDVVRKLEPVAAEAKTR